MKETEVAQAVVDWLEEERPSWRVYQELKPNAYGGVADIVCIREVARGEDLMKYVWVIEVKTSMSLAVIKQADSWDVEFRSVAVPTVSSKKARDERSWWYAQIKRKFNLGSIIVNAVSGVASERWSPPMNSLRTDPKYNFATRNEFIQLAESGLTDGFSEAGSEAGGHWTPYKQSMLEVKDFLKENPGSTSREIVEAVGRLHYSSENSARSSITKSLTGWEKDWCRTEKFKSGYLFYVKE